jgi:phosphoenolpyruvate carboxylase
MAMSRRKKTISLDEETYEIIKQLERTGYFDEVFDSFSEFVKHHLVEAHGNPEKVKRQLLIEKKKQLDQRIKQLEKQIPDSQSTNKIDKELKDYIKDKVDFMERCVNQKRNEPNDFYKVFQSKQNNLFNGAKNIEPKLTTKRFKELIKEEAKERDSLRVN